MKLIYAAVFALFPLAAPAQTLDSSLLSALCNDGYYEDTAGQCGAGEVLSIAGYPGKIQCHSDSRCR